MARISSYPIVTPKEIDTLIISQGYDIDADEPIEGNPTGSVTIGSVIDLVNTGLAPGTGTVTSLGVSMPSAFTVSNSPVTSAGVINITGSGTSAQYIDGTGSLQDFDRDSTSNTLGYKIIPSDFDFSNIPSSYSNSIWEIRNHHDLGGANITLPANVILKFEGGKFSNGTIIGNNTKIDSDLSQLFDNIVLEGYFNVDKFVDEWFGIEVENNTYLASQANTYIVKSQDDFDNINAIINNNPVSKFYLKTGVYDFTQNEISISSVNGKEVLITALAGESPIIRSKGVDYSMEDAKGVFINHYKVDVADLATDFKTVSFIDGENNYVEKSSTGIVKADSYVTIHDSVNKIAKVLIPSELDYLKGKDAEYFKNSTLKITSLWRMNNLQIDSVGVDGYLYFIYTTSDGVFDTYYNNNGLQYAQLSIDNIYTPELKNGVTVYGNEIYIPIKTKILHSNLNNSFLNISDSVNSSFEISGIEFNGAPIYQSNVFGAELGIFNCSNSENITFKNNSFKNIASRIFRNDSTNVSIIDNKFDLLNSVGTMYGNDLSFLRNNIECKNMLRIEPTTYFLGENMLIEGNVCKNSIYNSLHIPNGNKPTTVISGRVSGNLIYCTSDFNSKPRFSLNDGGAIYINNGHSGIVTIESNVVYNIYGGDMSGIYLDDGCSNTSVLNNLIYNIKGRSISARQSDGLGGASVLPCINITIDKNILDSFPWIGTSLDTNGCSFTDNIFLSPKDKLYNSTFNYYNYKITVLNYSISGNTESPFDIKNDIVSINDYFYEDRSSFVNSFLTGLYPNTNINGSLMSSKQLASNVTSSGIKSIYSTGSNYANINLSFVKKINEVSVSFKMKISYQGYEEKFLFRITGGVLKMSRLSNFGKTANSNAGSLYRVKYNFISESGLYNSYLQLFLQHTSITAIKYDFYDVVAVGNTPDFLDTNLFVKYNGSLATLPGTEISLSNGYPNKIKGTTAERPDGNYYIPNGYIYFDTDLMKQLTYTQIGTSSWKWLIDDGGSGITSDRPLSTYIMSGYNYFDTTLGLPIWWNGVNWINSVGTIV